MIQHVSYILLHLVPSLTSPHSTIYQISWPVVALVQLAVLLVQDVPLVETLRQHVSCMPLCYY